MAKVLTWSAILLYACAFFALTHWARHQSREMLALVLFASALAITFAPVPRWLKDPQDLAVGPWAHARLFYAGAWVSTLGILVARVIAVVAALGR